MSIWKLLPLALLGLTVAFFVYSGGVEEIDEIELECVSQSTVGGVNFLFVATRDDQRIPYIYESSRKTPPFSLKAFVQVDLGPVVTKVVLNSLVLKRKGMADVVLASSKSPFEFQRRGMIRFDSFGDTEDECWHMTWDGIVSTKVDIELEAEFHFHEADGKIVRRQVSYGFDARERNYFEIKRDPWGIFVEEFEES